MTYLNTHIQHFISDCVIRHAKRDSIVLGKNTYTFSTRYGKFLVPFYSIECEQTKLQFEIHGNHQHYNRLVEAIEKDLNNKGE